MCHILIPVKMTIAICFLDILYVACGDDNFFFSGFDYDREGYITIYEHLIFSNNQSAA